MFCYDNNLTYPVYLSDQKFESCMDLLLISDECKSHYVYIKDFDRFMFNKTKNKTRKYFGKCCLQCFSSEEILIDHRTDCLVINWKKGVKLKSGTIKFKNYFKQLPVPFKIYADFECILKRLKVILLGVIQLVHTQESIKIIFLAVLLIKLFVLTISFVRKLFCTEERMLCHIRHLNLMKTHSLKG